ncbi:MAG: ORF6N domain-containing protein [Acidobacteriota bacterium]
MSGLFLQLSLLSRSKPFLYHAPLQCASGGVTMKNSRVIPAERIEKAILYIRGEKVMLDSDLASLYGVTTARLNQQVTRNIERFPADFMFELSKEEFKSLMLQIATSKKGRGGRRKLPRVFTEHGAIMAANVLNSERAVQASVQVVRAFVRLRQMLTSNSALARKLDELEGKYDRQFRVVFDAIRQLMSPPVTVGKQIGFRSQPKK